MSVGAGIERKATVGDKIFTLLVDKDGYHQRATVKAVVYLDPVDENDDGEVVVIGYDDEESDDGSGVLGAEWLWMYAWDETNQYWKPA